MSKQDRVGPCLDDIHLSQKFRVYYQPIVSLETSRIRGFEALVRWQSPDRGFVSAAEVIPVAEEIGLIVPLDWWVLGEACRHLRAWQEQFPVNPALAISVNLSSRQFLRPRLLIEQIDQILRETGLDARSLNLEIPKDAIRKNVGSAMAILSELRALGVQLQIDNFGTGYSSLGYLHHLIDTLKIDRAFVSEMSRDDEYLKIVQASIQSAHDLNLDVIAKGLETAEQLAQLKVLNCNYAQGYFFCEPVDSMGVEAVMTADVEAQTTLNPHFCGFEELDKSNLIPESEPKILRAVELSDTAWNALTEIAKHQNKTISQLLEEWALTEDPAAPKPIQ